MNELKQFGLKQFVVFTLRHYKVILGTAVILSVLSVFILAGIQTNFSIRAFDMPQNMEDKQLREYNSHFSKPETETMMIIIRLPGGLTTKNLDKVLLFCAALKEVKGYTDLLSLAEMPVTYDVGEEESEIAPFEKLYRERGAEFSLQAIFSGHMVERFYNRRLSRLYIYLRAPFHTGYEPGHRVLCNEISRLAALHLDAPVEFVGFPSLLFTLKETFYKETAWFFIAYLLLFIFLFYLHFKDLKLLLFSIAIVTLSTLWSLALLVLAGLKLNFFGGLTFLLIYISCSSDIFHLLKKYRSESSTGDIHQRIVNAAVDTIPKSFFTSFSTAVGFGLLCFSKVPGLINFGAYTAIGVMLAFMVTLFLGPSLMKILIGKSGELREGLLTPVIEKAAGATYSTIRRFPRVILFISAVLVIGAALVMKHSKGLDLASYIEIRPGLQEARLLAEIENEQGGLMPFYIYFHAPTGTSMTREEVNTLIVKTTFTLERDLAQRYPYAAVDGLYTELRLLAEEELDFEEFETLASGLITSEPGRLARYYDDKTGYCRIILRIKNEDIKKFIKARDRFLGMFPYNTEFQWFVYSEAFKIYDSILYMANDLRSSIILDLICISAILGIILRSWLVFLASLYVNLLPLVISYALAVLTGMPMHVMVIAGFCVVVGIIQDDTIYLMMDGYGKLQRKEDDFQRLYLKLIPPLTTVSIFILSGAAIISFSNFLGIHYFGIILLLNIFIGFLFDVFVSTAIVYLRFKKDEVNN